MKRSIQTVALFLVAVPPVAVSFTTSHQNSHGTSQSNRKDMFRKRTSVIVSDVSDEWWMDDASSDKEFPLSEQKDDKKFDISSSNTNAEKEEPTSPFLQGEALKQLRTDLESYKENLKWAQVMNDQARVDSLTKEIEEQEQRDPEVVYNKARKLIAEAKSASRAVLKPDLKEKLIKHWSEQKEQARECLPRFHMEGMWVGNYGGGPQLVNITYAGDTLVATKVTGDDTVPRGEVSFTANLSPPPLNNSISEDEEQSASDMEEHTVLQSKYGESIFPGQGQLAKRDFKDPKFISGVFIVYDTHRFSFSWVPTKHHVFFVRPSPHETIRLLRDVISKEDELDNMRDHLTRCFEMDMTTSIAREQQRSQKDNIEDPFQRIKRQRDLELLSNGINFTDVDSNAGGSIFKFWRANKWKNYIDRMFGSDGTLQ